MAAFLKSLLAVTIISAVVVPLFDSSPADARNNPYCKNGKLKGNGCK